MKPVKTVKKAAPKKAAAKAKPKKAYKPLKAKPGETVLLSGGNPQIAKGYGDAPVQAYIAAMPGWKSEMGRKLDRIIEKTVPGVRKAVKWNSPMYGKEDNYWFLGVHVFDKYIKVAFFKGAQLKPVPPDTSKQRDVRYYNIHEGKLDEAQFADWVKQASKLPGEKM
ncbi:MAG TPA: DUF1801 domain-containing protein [Hyphomonadaceae bacterium]|jgi:hypothetical protein|nr:DUF1801 domain-containing protein [Hyphomonadaceae bacterium]